MSKRRSHWVGGLLAALLLISKPLLALKVPEPVAPVVESTQPVQPPDKAGSESQGRLKQPPRPATEGFVPSERIKADSAVSFPVDI